MPTLFKKSGIIRSFVKEDIGLSIDTIRTCSGLYQTYLTEKGRRTHISTFSNYETALLGHYGWVEIKTGINHTFFRRHSPKSKLTFRESCQDPINPKYDIYGNIISKKQNIR